MARRQRFSRSRVARSGFTAGILLIANFGNASVARAQDDAPRVSPISANEGASDAGLRAYVASLPSAPTPKVEAAASAGVQAQSGIQIPVERGRSFYRLDRKSLMFGLMLGGAEMFDGVTTRYFIHHCSHCFENDPMSRALLGTHPSWGGMIPAGIVEAAVSTYSYQWMSRSPNRFLRAAAPLVPIALTAVHVIEGTRNIGLKNKYRCADPGYVVVGAACVPAPSPTSIGAPGDGLGSRRSPM